MFFYKTKRLKIRRNRKLKTRRKPGKLLKETKQKIPKRRIPRKRIPRRRIPRKRIPRTKAFLARKRRKTKRMSRSKI